MGIKKSGYESDHSPSSRATVRKKWSYPSAYPFITMAYTKIIFPTLRCCVLRQSNSSKKSYAVFIMQSDITKDCKHTMVTGSQLLYQNSSKKSNCNPQTIQYDTYWVLKSNDRNKPKYRRKFYSALTIVLFNATAALTLHKECTYSATNDQPTILYSLTLQNALASLTQVAFISEHDM